MGLSVILLINLLVVSESKTRMIVPCGTVSVIVLATPLVTPCSQRSLQSFSPLPWGLLSQACSSIGCQLQSVSVNGPGLDPFLKRSLAWGCSYKGLWLQSAPLDFLGSGVPRRAKDLTQAYSFRGH